MPGDAGTPTNQDHTLDTCPDERPADVGGHRLGSHLLGPHVIGQRVVVRRILPGEFGPTGGPAFTDTLGVCLSWADGECVVQKEDASTVTIDITDIVSGKPVPPRHSVRLRVTPRVAHGHSLAMWGDVETHPLGEWLGRCQPDPGPNPVARANSVLAMGDPGVPIAEAAERVTHFYRSLGQPAWAQVESGGDVDLELTGLGWVAARQDEADTCFEIASASRVLRNADQQLRTIGDAAVAVTETEDGPRVLIELRSPEGAVVARGRAALDRDWVGIYDVWVADTHRRRGLALRVMSELLGWGTSRGALTAYLQVRMDNEPALDLYRKLGFEAHHVYRYLKAPDPSQGR